MTRILILPRNAWDDLPPDLADAVQDGAAECFAGYDCHEFDFSGWLDLALLERVARREPVSRLDMLRAIGLMKADKIAERAGLVSRLAKLRGEKRDGPR